MKANELMIGDWFKFSVEKYPYKMGEVFQIKTYYDIALHDRLCGIPLTAEILENNGITLLEVGDNGIVTPKSQRNRYEKWFIHTKFVDTYLWYDRLLMRWHLHNMSGAKFKHVHELQHSLRLCGLNDLADNFKSNQEGTKERG